MTTCYAILGGTFDPLHIGHLAIAEDVRFTLQAQRVVFVPAAQQPFKVGSLTTSAAHRMTMVQLGIADNPCFVASDVELRRGGVSYTVDTIAELQQCYSDAELVFIVGTDAAVDLPRWHAIERLLTLCKVAVVERPGYSFDLERLLYEVPAAHDRVVLIPGPALDISASELRYRLRSGRPTRYHLLPAVQQYIESHGLYQST